MLSPKRTKYRKYQKGNIRGEEHRCVNLVFGTFGIVAAEPARITARQIEAARKTINRKVKRIGKLWIRIFPDIPVTSKPTEVRMGKGKGAVDHWVARVKPGRVLFELEGVSFDLAKEALRGGSAKLPIKTRFIHKEI